MKIKNIITKLITLIIFLMVTVVITGCQTQTVSIEITASTRELKRGEQSILTIDVKGSKDTTYTLSTTNDTLVSLSDNNGSCIVTATEAPNDATLVIITATSNADNTKTAEVSIMIKGKDPVITPVVKDIMIGIEGASEVKSGSSISLTANVTGTENKEVTWSITSGSEYATVDANGVVKANDVDGDKNIIVVATSKEDNTVTATTIITIVSKPQLTQAMIDKLNVNKISFEGYVKINLYTVGGISTLYNSFITTIKTAMDGTNWYSEYENGDTGTIMSLYYKRHQNTACQVGVSFMNEEEYLPLLDDNNNQVSWNDAGLYNNFTELTVNDFQFDEETWRYVYVGSDANLPEKVVASSNPYDFIADGFALIIEENEILGVYAKSKDDYTILENYRAIQELFVAINYGDVVDVPSITKFTYDPIHEELKEAIANMHALKSYVTTFKEITASYLTTGYVESGYQETVLEDICHYRPYTTSYVRGEEVKNFDDTSTYGNKKVEDNLYNTYRMNQKEMPNEPTTYSAVRAYQDDIAKAKPSFGFAAEIFTEYAIDEEEGTITYYVNDVMSSVASTFYQGVGNDINLYGIFATRGYTSDTASFTPYVVVKDGYIIEACFYFYLGSIYGVVELDYTDFDSAELPEDVTIDFETRQVPKSWTELFIEVSTDSGTTTDDQSVNALEYLKTFYEDDNIEERMPFFGLPLGDTYGFGLTTIFLPAGTTTSQRAICFYYDVPLDIDYTIDSSLDKVENYLLELGFTKNNNSEFVKGDISVAPRDSSLDLVIYVWKTN